MTESKDVKHGTPIYKVYKVSDVEVEGDPNNDNAPLTFTITTDVTDRDKDIVDPAGAVVENYSKNAVMQWAHQYEELPVGKSVEMFATKIKAVKDGQEQDFNAIKARVVFQPDSNYHDSYTGIRGSMVRRMYVTGFLNAVSIGFDPLEWEPIEEKGEKTPSELLGMVPNNGTRFVKWDLLEFSAVPVPANPQALVDRNYDSVAKAQLRRVAADVLEQCKEGECPRLTKGVIPYKQTPKAPEGEAWQGPAEVAAASIDDLKVMCTWFDSSKATADLTKGDFKLPHHKQQGYALVRQGLIGAGNALTGARGGVNIPAGDEAGVKSHLEKHYAEFQLDAPWNKSLEEDSMELKHTVADDRFVEQIKAIIIKEGRVLSGKNETDLKDGVAQINAGVKKVNDVLGKVNSGGQSEPTAPTTPPTPPAQEPKSMFTVSFPLGHEASYLKNEAELAEEVVEEEEQEVTLTPKPAEVQSENPDEDIYIIDETVYDEELQAYITQVRDEVKEELETDDNQSDLATQREEPT
jgi:hypothetical protein